MRCLIRFDSFRNVLAGVGILGNPPGRPLLGAMRTQGFTLGYSRFLPPGERQDPRRGRNSSIPGLRIQTGGTRHSLFIDLGSMKDMCECLPSR